MAFPQDPLNPDDCAVDRVRILVGDIDCYDVELSDDLYIYFLDSNEQNESKAAVQALKALVAKYAKGMEEIVGDVEVNFKQRYEGYVDLLKKYLKDPSYGLMGTINLYAGGLSFSEKRSDELDTDLKTSPFAVVSSLKRGKLAYQAPYYKDTNNINNIG